jgi:hypothetical protein
MKKLFLLALVFLSAGLFGQISETLNTITIQNNTGFEFIYIFFSPGDSEYWGPDILGADTLPDGESAEFLVSYPDYSNDFDIMMVDEDGDTYSFYNYTISDDSPAYIEVTLDDYDASDSIDMNFVTAEFRNELDYDIWYFFFSPADSTMLGVDLLNSSTTLDAGETFTFLIPASSQDVTYDFYGYDEDEDRYSFQVDVSDTDFSKAIEATDIDL